MRLILLVLFISCPLMGGCTVVGAVVGKQIDDHGDKKKYGPKLASKGMDADLAIIKAMRSPPPSSSRSIYHEPHVKKETGERSYQRRGPIVYDYSDPSCQKPHRSFKCSDKTGKCLCFEDTYLPLETHGSTSSN